MTNRTVSVAMCTYNGIAFLKKQLDSIIRQTKPVDEIVICDDRSKDATCELIRAFIKECPVKTKFIENPVNLGYTLNFEQAISLCSGDIIFLSDQDDIWMPHKVETVCRFFEQHADKDMVFTNAELINAFDVKSYDQTLFDVVDMNHKNKQIIREGYGYDVFCACGRVTGSTVAIRASFIPYCIPFPKMSVKTIHDEIMAICAVTRNKIDFIDECLIRYRLHANQSVGISLLFKFPPKEHEAPENLRLWQENIVRGNRKAMELMQFVHKRFWTFHRRGNLLHFLKMFLSKEYTRHHHNPSNVFLRDMKGVFRRIVDKMKKKDENI